VHGFRCCDNIVPNAKCQRVLVLALCLVAVGEIMVGYLYVTQANSLQPSPWYWIGTVSILAVVTNTLLSLQNLLLK